MSCESGALEAAFVATAVAVGLSLEELITK